MKHKKKRIIRKKPKGSCTYGRCLQPGALKKDGMPIGRCIKHYNMPPAFQKKTLWQKIAEWFE